MHRGRMMLVSEILQARSALTGQAAWAQLQGQLLVATVQPRAEEPLPVASSTYTLYHASGGIFAASVQ